MALTIKLSVTQLRAKKTKLENLNEKLAKEYKNLDQNISQIDSYWDGDAANAFIKKYNKDKQTYNKFIALVKQYIDTLDKIIANYEKAEAANVQIVK